MAKRKGRGEEFYLELVEAYARSGKSQRVFAAERGVPAGTLSHWCYKLKKRGAARPRARTVQPAPARPASSGKGEGQPGGKRRPAFLPVQVVGAGPEVGGDQGYEVVLAKGVLRLPPAFDPIRVGALLRALEVVC